MQCTRPAYAGYQILCNRQNERRISFSRVLCAGKPSLGLAERTTQDKWNIPGMGFSEHGLRFQGEHPGGARDPFQVLAPYVVAATEIEIKLTSYRVSPISMATLPLAVEYVKTALCVALSADVASVVKSLCAANTSCKSQEICRRRGGLRVRPHPDGY